jgi:hypothetical protein
MCCPCLDPGIVDPVFEVATAAIIIFAFGWLVF